MFGCPSRKVLPTCAAIELIHAHSLILDDLPCMDNDDCRHGWHDRWPDSRSFLASGAMVGVGSLAGWVAMIGEVRLGEMALLFAWRAAWEIGGRNIVNDFADVEEDVRLGVKTVPVVYGGRAAARLTLWFLAATFLASLGLQSISHLGLIYLALSAATGFSMLLWPGLRPVRDPRPQNAMALFNRASLYPPVMRLVLIASLFLST